MKRTRLAAFAAVFLFSGLTSFSPVATVTPALAQGSDVVVLDGLRLPRSHQYEVYNPENSTYGTVNLDTVPSHVRQGTWIYDRTARAWVSHPSVGNPNPQYVAGGREFRREAASDHDVLVQDALRLPRSHRYELYNPENSTYGTVRRRHRARPCEAGHVDLRPHRGRVGLASVGGQSQSAVHRRPP